MSDYQGTLTREKRTPDFVPALPAHTAPPSSALFPCPDCSHQCSRQAEACPSCGRFFQRFDTMQTVDRLGWTTTIARGVFVGWLVCTLVNAALLFVLIVILFGLELVSAPQGR